MGRNKQIAAQAAATDVLARQEVTWPEEHLPQAPAEPPAMATDQPA